MTPHATSANGTQLRARKTRALGCEPRPPRAVPAVPATLAELLARAHALAGVTLAELAERAKLALPTELRRAKGFAGELVERALGVHARRAGPDLPALGVELKTIPLSRTGRPRESTFVCTIAARSIADSEWIDSAVRRKLRCVLFVPIESEPLLALGERRIGSARLWSPSAAEEAALRADWEEHVAVIGRGEIELLNARAGHCLQVRPKARNGSVLGRAIDERGAPIRSLPRAFYLRASFTARLFA